MKTHANQAQISLIKTTLFTNTNLIGFQKKNRPLKQLYARIVGALDKGNYAFSVFLDFAKASDTVDHKILLSKLQNNGIRGIAKNWFLV